MKPAVKPLEVGEALKSQSASSGPAIDLPQEFGDECGGRAGVPYRSFAPPPSHITRVTVWHRDLVDGILLETDRGALPRIGGTGEHHDIRQESFELQPDEFLTGISVEFEQFIDRVVFYTNKSSYGPFGGEGGQIKRRLDAPSGRRVIGFRGRHWEFIDSIQLLVI